MSSSDILDGEMRVGQGYNSHTQKKCFLNAVLVEPAWAPRTPKTQKVDFNWDYVSTMSDISKSIGVSAALTINCGGFSGTGKGDFINEDIISDDDSSRSFDYHDTKICVFVSGSKLRHTFHCQI